MIAAPPSEESAEMYRDVVKSLIEVPYSNEAMEKTSATDVSGALQ